MLTFVHLMAATSRCARGVSEHVKNVLKASMKTAPTRVFPWPFAGVVDTQNLDVGFCPYTAYMQWPYLNLENKQNRARKRSNERRLQVIIVLHTYPLEGLPEKQAYSKPQTAFTLPTDLN